jgi:hypothetical protein
MTMASVLPLLVDSYGSGTSSRLLPVSRDVLQRPIVAFDGLIVMQSAATVAAQEEVRRV